MSKKNKTEKDNLHTIYISERLRNCMQPVSQCALTAVIAPMGYGKTTAVNWLLAAKIKTDHAAVIKISIYSDNLSIFWRSVQKAFAFAGLDFLSEYECPYDEASAVYLTETLCHFLAGEQEYYIFIDDFHLLTDNRASEFLYILASHLPGNVHLIVASRNRFLPGSAIVRLGSRLYQIQEDVLRLTEEELAVYIYRCGTDLSSRQLETLFHTSEGWFSAVYLNLCFYAKNGELPDNNANIYEMFAESMLKPLPKEQKEFLSTMGLADEFTVDMARMITERDDTEQILLKLTEQNAFVTRLSNGKYYRFHHMMKECAQRVFSEMEWGKQKEYYNRYGIWYEKQKMYIHALSVYRKCQNYDGMLQVVIKDAGILLASLKPADVLKVLSECPASKLKEYPLALLVLMRSMFNWKQIPKMLELKELLMQSIQEHPDLSREEKGNLLGECDLIMSFLMYNDISKMSQFHRSASAQMSRTAISIRREGGWTFGSPSVLMMFHRSSGNLDRELDEMQECMPHYYKVTNGHGQGAERIMLAEARYLQGRFVDARISLENAYAHIEGNGQENIALCCDFLMYRLFLVMDHKPEKSFQDRYEELQRKHNTSWRNMFDSISAYYHALTGENEKIPALFREHKLSRVNFLAPGKPMMEMIENQVYLEQGLYSKIAGRNERLLETCENMHYGLVALYIQIQTAAAYEKLGKRVEARTLLRKLINEAVPDGLLMPFAENYCYLAGLLDSLDGERDELFIAQIIKLGKAFEEKCIRIRNENTYPDIFANLTERDRKIVQYISERLSNKEIASRLFLSEGTVKQYVNQIYSKIQITGDTRMKRQRLLELLQEKTNH